MRTPLRLTAALALGLLIATAWGAGASAAGNPRDRNWDRIVGGSATTIDQYPWQVAVALNPAMFPGPAFDRQFCGGTLVAPTVVVTAAHCVYDTGPNADLDPTNDCFDDGTEGFNFAPEEQTAISGRTQLSNEAAGEEIVVDEIYYFAAGPGGAPTAVPQSGPGNNGLYDCNTSEWDVALLQLVSPSSGQPVQIAGGDERALWRAGDPLSISGWGTTSEGGNKSDVLRAAQVERVRDTTCASPTVYGGGFHTETMFCAGIHPQGGVDTCQGDSGGPIVASAEIGSVIGSRLIGDTSFGFGCARPNFPGIYGRLAGDPMRVAVGTAVQSIAGVNAIGSGARPVAAPKTRITRHPRKKVMTEKRRKRVRFKFRANEASSFQCKLDKGRFKACDSPFAKRVGPGRHTFKVRAIDRVGQRDSSPDRFSFRVRRQQPEPPPEPEPAPEPGPAPGPEPPTATATPEPCKRC